MDAVTIWDTTERNGSRLLSFDLVDILRLFVDELPRSAWKVSEVEAIGSGSNKLMRIAESGRFISGEELLSIAEDLVQVIDGDFRGLIDGNFWIRILAIDSTEFSVISPHQSVIEKIQSRFSDVRKSPLDAVHYGD